MSSTKLKANSTIIDAAALLGSSRATITRRVSQAGLGVLSALRAGKMNITDAETDLFNLATYQAARRRRLDRNLIEFLEWGMELDDVASLAPGGLPNSFAQMEKLLLRAIAATLVKRRRPRSDATS